MPKVIYTMEESKERRKAEWGWDAVFYWVVVRDPTEKVKIDQRLEGGK